MAFRNANLSAHMITFNSAVSSDFLEFYNGIIDEEIKSSNEGPKHRTFAPSQMRCDRVSWFRLRGVEPDTIKVPDRFLSYTAEVGTSCHENIQNRLIKHLGADWITVQEWVDANPDLFKDYDMTLDTSRGNETLIEMRKPFPVRFACDGIIRFKGIVYLLEIKTSEFSSWNDLIEPKSKHIDQITCYSTLLHIPNVLFLYQDRNYGAFKCFEITISDAEHTKLKDRMNNVMQLVDANIAPEGLPVGDDWCSSNMCPYYKKCQSWGR